MSPRHWQSIVLRSTWQLSSAVCFAVGIGLVRLVQMNRFANGHGGHNFEPPFYFAVSLAGFGLLASLVSLPFGIKRAWREHCLRS